MMYLFFADSVGEIWGWSGGRIGGSGAGKGGCLGGGHEGESGKEDGA